MVIEQGIDVGARALCRYPQLRARLAARGALAGWPALDLVAALLMGFMILKLGVELAWGALRELIDEGLDEADVDAMAR